MKKEKGMQKNFTNFTSKHILLSRVVRLGFLIYDILLFNNLNIVSVNFFFLKNVHILNKRNEKK